VRVDGAVETDPARRLSGEERIEVLPEAAVPIAADRGAGLLVHVDREVVVARKPAGVLTLPVDERDRDTLLHRVAAAVRRRETRYGGGGGAPLRAVQRLDRDTSGLLVFARTIPAQRALQEQLRAKSVERRYLALVHGEPRDGVHDTHLVADRGDGLRGSWRPRRGRSAVPPADAKRAVTRVRVLERLRGACLVACELETGRQHQIRIHLSEAGHPLVGESLYVRDFAGPWIRAPRAMLHATLLGFLHPIAERRLRYEEPPPADFQAMLARLRGRR